MSEVYKAIVAVASDISKTGIGKNRSNVQQGYKFRGIDDIYNEIAPLLAKHKLCILPRVLARSVVERATAKGGVLFYVTVDMEFDFVSSEDGSKHTVRTFGEAMDSADKATNKAMSAAYKYFAIQTFAIPTEGDNDADATTHEVATKKRSAPRLDPVPSGNGPNAKQIKLLHYQGIRVYGKSAWADKLAAGVKKATGSDTGSPTELSRDDFSKWVDYLKDKPDFDTEPDYLPVEEEEALAIEAEADVADADGELPF